MDIFNEIGEPLESDLSIVKIDLVLSVNFTEKVAQRDDVNLAKVLSCRYGVPIYQHDLRRTIRLSRLFDLFSTHESFSESVVYFQDSLMVVYEWILRFRVLYGSRNRDGAYMEFKEVVESYDVQSIKAMRDIHLQAMFYYLYNRCMFTYPINQVS